MTQLSSKHIENCSREIGRWAKAIRLINSMQHNLPSNSFPEPDLIKPGKKPFDLQVIWEADNPGHSVNLRKRITTAFVSLQGDMYKNPWQLEENGFFGLRGRTRLGKKTTLYLRLLVSDGHHRLHRASEI